MDITAMHQVNRLAEGGLIDREKPVSFTFNGRRYCAYKGDTIASALLANGIDVIARSLKFHRPRGVMTSGIEEPNAFVSVTNRHGTSPVVCAPMAEIHDGDEVSSLNCFPSVRFDVLRVLDFTHRLWIAGFYNKTFMWPNWHWYEGLLRAAAGVGRVRNETNSTRYFRRNLHCDLLVVGSGPAGLAAALTAASSGARTVLVEQDVELGGSLLTSTTTIDRSAAGAWLANTRETLAAANNVSILTASTVCGYYDHNVVLIADRSSFGVERTWTVRASRVILATGAIEQPPVFPYNDRPGILLSGAALVYLRRFAVRPARVMAVVTNNDSAYRTAFALEQEGIQVPAIVDSRPDIPDNLRDAAQQRQIPVFGAAIVVSTRGRPRISEISITKLGEKRPFRKIACDGLAVSGGFNPTTHLFAQAGGDLTYDRRLAAFVPGCSRQAVAAAGAANGTFPLDDALTEGSRAASEALSLAGFSCSPHSFSAPPGYACDPGESGCGTAVRSDRQWVDHFHDATVSDIALAHAEGFSPIEHLKRYTTIGMALDQGKTSNLNAVKIAADLRNRSVDEFVTTTYRPMYSPTTLGAIAGQYRGALYRPTRVLPAVGWHTERGAVFGSYGEWKRPDYYRENGVDMSTAVHREVRAVRTGVGIADASPLGKVEVVGPQAGEFLDRLLVNKMSTLAPGAIRYGILLDENGVLFDDAVVARLSVERYLLQTTSSNAGNVLSWLERWHQCEWPELECLILPVGAQWSVVTVTGPHAPAVLTPISSDIVFDQIAPLAIATGRIAGAPARVQRTRFTGETTFEIAVPADRCVSLLDAVIDDGAALAVGMKAMDVLRIEMGRLHVGTDTDSTTNVNDIGWAGLAAAKDRDFIGKRSIRRPADLHPDRRQFVGVVQTDTEEPIEAGAHFVSGPNDPRSLGFVTSACFSPTMGKHIGLGLLEGGREKSGHKVNLYNDGRITEAVICRPGVYEPHVQRG